jgi:hypothetical protein
MGAQQKGSYEHGVRQVDDEKPVGVIASEGAVDDVLRER